MRSGGGGGGGMHGRGACVVGSMLGRACVTGGICGGGMHGGGGGACVAGRQAWQRVCMAGGVHGRGGGVRAMHYPL